MNSEWTVEAETIFHSASLSLIADVHNSANRFLMTSEITRFNQLAVGATMLASPIFLELLQLAQFWAVRTDYRFNPTILPAVVAIGYGMSPTSESTPVVHHIPYELDFTQRTVTKTSAAHLDFGGFAKGWTGEQLAKLHGDTVVNAGGDIAVLTETWIEIAHPFNDGWQIATVLLNHHYIATSNKYKRQFAHGHHLLNGQTGKNPRSSLGQVTVVSPRSLVEAEVLTKVLFSLAPRQLFTYMEHHFPDVAFLLVTDDGQLHWNEHFQQLKEASS